MRLTLRTLLAYLDDLLEPGDAGEISRKVEESKFASDLVHRIRNSTRRLRLGAPRVDGRGMGLDANTVAEYLDNTLPPEQVPEFEKVCLESDVHLAEVASCHQILTLVLGEPASVEDSLRARVYGVATGVDAAQPVAAALAVPAEEGMPSPAADGATDVLADVVVAPAAARGKPDYMRVGQGLPIRSLAITLVCGFVLAAVALRAMGPFGPTHPVWRLFGSTPPPTPASTPAASEPALPVADATDQQRPAESPDPLAGDAATNPPQPAAPTVPATPAAEQAPPADSPASVPSPAIVAPPAPPAAAPATAMPSPAAPPAMESPPAVGDAPAASVPAPPPAQAAPASVGRYISEEQVLGRLDNAAGVWYRLAADEPLAPGDRLLSLPTYRPQVLVAPNVKITFSGAASAQVQGGSDAASATLRIPYGQAVIISVDNAPARIRLDLAGRGGVAALSDPQAVLAIEVTPFVPAGGDPLTAARSALVRLWPVSGQTNWEEESGAQRVSAGQMLSLWDKQPASVSPVTAQPTWIEGADTTDIDLRASQELRRFLALDRPMNLSLLERAEFRQEEVRALACRCLCGMDFFEPSVKALNDAAQRSYWHTHFDALRAGMQRQPQTAARLLADIQKVHAEDAATIFRLLRGYTPEQLQADGARQLVEGLEHQLMIVRVLAITNLRRITGRTFLYNPDQPPSQEKSKILRWRKSLEAGEIRWKSPPTLTGEPSDAAAAAPAAPVAPVAPGGADKR